MEPITIRMGGYGPPDTGFSRALKRIGERLQQRFGDQVDVKYVWNIMDFGYRAEDILWLVESGVLTLGYQSSSYLTDRVPALGFVDLPFLFQSNTQARAAMDGALGELLVKAIEERDRSPDPGLVRERLPPHLQPAAHRTPARGPRRHAHPRAAERDPETDLRAVGRGADAHGPDRGDPDDRVGGTRRAGKSARQYGRLRGAQVSSLPHPHAVISTSHVRSS